MIINFTTPDRTIKETTTVFYKISENINFPVACIGKDSYIWNSIINSGIQYTISMGFAIHNLQFGKFVAGAHGIEFCMGINHNYLNLAMGVSDLFKNDSERDFGQKYKEKGLILIQNDVWLGHKITVMPGIIIHNGAVVAANSHVVKDVPPYAIVGGNPAKIIKYRFSKEIIDKLLTIEWWNWSDEKIQNNTEFFYNEDVNTFCDKFYKEAFEEKQKIKELGITRLKHTYLFFPDFTEPYSVWERVLKEFITKFKENDDYLLIAYINEETNQELVDKFNVYTTKASTYNNVKCCINVFINTKENERAIFKSTDYFIANRSKDTVRHSCYADENNVKIISGVDFPIF